jgi:hypothetical protein
VGSPRRAIPIVLVALIAGCTFPDLHSPSATPSALPTPAATPAPTPSAAPTASADATPDPAAIPDFSAGELIVTAIDGLRVRQRPGLDGVVVTGLLPRDATLQVVMGPILAEELGWYLVTDADQDEPQFEEGWIAAGYEPEAFLAGTGEVSGRSPYIASFAQTGDAEYGPVEIGRGDHAIRWVATDLDGGGCRFAVSLAAAGDDPVPAIRSTIGNADVVPGTLQPGSFDALGVRGPAFVTVMSDCGWTLVLQRVPEPSSPPPTP